MSHLTHSTRASIFREAHKQGKALGIGESLEEAWGEQLGQAAATRRPNRLLFRMLAHLHHNASVVRKFQLVKPFAISRGAIWRLDSQRTILRSSNGLQYRYGCKCRCALQNQRGSEREGYRCA